MSADHLGGPQSWQSSLTPTEGDRGALILLFDGHCSVCTRAATWLRERDFRGRLRCIPNQRPGILERVGLTRREVDQAVWLVDCATDERISGAPAISRALVELGGPWGAVGRATGLPGVRWAARAGYRWFAAHRSWFARRGWASACDHPEEDCGGRLAIPATPTLPTPQA